MATKKGQSEGTPLGLRKQATQFLHAKAGADFSRVLEDLPGIFHELQVHQIELALQNDELRNAQLQLEESRARYMELYEHAPVGYFTFDQKGRISAVNLTGSRQLGLEKSALPHRAFSAYLSQADADLFYLHLQKVFDTGTKQSCTLTLPRENGEAFFVQLDSIAFATITGETPCCLTTVTDISELKMLERTWKASETRYRLIFNATREGIVLLDVETGQVLDVNPFLLEMLGYAREDVLGKKIWESEPFREVAAAKATFLELQKKMNARYDNVRLKTKNGRRLAVEYAANVHLIDGQKLIQCNIREIGKENSVDEVSRQALNGTEQRVRERRSGLQENHEQREREKQELQRLEADLGEALAEIKSLTERLVLENIYFSQETKNTHRFENILGESDSLKAILYRVEQVAPTNTTVLVTGETGTGKELIAAAIHNLSPRQARPLITVNCAALPANLLESELFGREKGAFTGADSQQIGRFEIANGSTLCLDEIGEMPLEMQVKLLRVLQHNEFERLGSSRTIKVDVRVVATTNRNLEEAIRAGLFRQDLFYRLNVFPLTVPPLRQRKEDIPLLVQAFVERYARKMGKRITSIPRETMRALLDYPWPGNVRELESIIERAIILCPGPGFQLIDKLTAPPLDKASEAGTLKEVEKRQILKVLSETRWRIEGQKGAAVILGLHPSTLRARMQKLDIARSAGTTPPA